jgi:hypothetical protein
MFIFAGILSVVCAAIIISPLFLARDGALASASSLNSPERLLATKNAILKRYIEDEKTFEDKKISKIVWEQRKQYLSNRYIDAARRLDYINDLIATQKKGEAKPHA